MADDSSYSSSWTREQDKVFENAIATYNIGNWEKIAEQVPGKSVEEIIKHYENLVHDIIEIESGRVTLPNYISSSCQKSNRKGKQDGNSVLVPINENKGSGPGQDSRRGIFWTEAEHTLFLQGLACHGKGDWRSISRNYVKTRTATQVASHAQKYFKRLNSQVKEGRRSSILDKTTLNNSQDPITGEPNQLANEISPSVPAVLTPAVGQSTGPPNPHVASDSSSPTQGTIVEGALLIKDPMTYDPMPPFDDDLCFDEQLCFNEDL